MKAEELRIGNLVYWKRISLDGGQKEVATIQNGGFISAHATNDAFDPIPLTEEWLLKFGFEKKEKYGWKGNGYDYQPETSKIEYQDFLIWAYENAFVFRFESYSWRATESDEWVTDLRTEIHFAGQYYEKMMERVYTMKPVEYVHQLQNLYFALTNIELEIKQMIVNHQFYMNITEKIKELSEVIKTEEAQIEKSKAIITESRSKVRQLKTLEKKANELFSEVEEEVTQN